MAEGTSRRRRPSLGRRPGRAHAPPLPTTTTTSTTTTMQLLLALLVLFASAVLTTGAQTVARETQEGETTPVEGAAGGGRIASWIKHKHLTPCLGCTEGEAMVLGHMFEDCSLYTFGQHMGIYPSGTNLTLATNETVLVHLVGSRLFIHKPQDFYALLDAAMRNATCPGPGDATPRLRNISSLCATVDPVDGALVGGVRTGGMGMGMGMGMGKATGKKRAGAAATDGDDDEDEDEDGPLCVIYNVSVAAASTTTTTTTATAGPMDGVAGLYGPGEYAFNFSAFQTAAFPYAFWSIQFLSLGGEEGPLGLLANVSTQGAFLNNPKAPPTPLLVNAFFIAALVVSALFFVVYSPAVGNSLIDLGARSPFLRRHVLEQRHPGPVPVPPALDGGGGGGRSSSVSRIGVGVRRPLSRSATGGSVAWHQGQHQHQPYVLMEDDHGGVEDGSA